MPDWSFGQIVLAIGLFAFYFILLVIIEFKIKPIVSQIFVKLMGRFNHWRMTPKIVSQFELSKETLLVLSLTSKNIETIYFQLVNCSIQAVRDGKRLEIQAGELKYIDDILVTEPLCIENLGAGKKITVENIAFDHEGTMALYACGRYWFGFPDGIYEYTIDGRAQRLGHWYGLRSSAILSIVKGYPTIIVSG